MISRGPDSGIYAMLRQAKLNNCKDKGKKLGRIPVLIYLSSSIWALPAQRLVKTVNVDIPLWYSHEYLQMLKEQ